MDKRMRIIAVLSLLVKFQHLLVLGFVITDNLLKRPAGPNGISSFTSSILFASTKSETQANSNNRRPTTVKPAKWIACSSTKELTRAVKAYVQPGDRVAELGSALRETSDAICESVGSLGSARLVDVKRNYPKREDVTRTTAMRREGDEEDYFTDRATFCEIPDYRAWSSALFFEPDSRVNSDANVSAFRSYDVLVADVSSMVGNDLDLTAVSLLQEFLDLNDGEEELDGKCRVVIVKSGALNSWARRLVHAQRLIRGSVSDSIQQRLQFGGETEREEKPNRAGFVPPVVIGTVGVEEYRRTIPHVVRPGDAVLEVGCHLGTSTVVIDETAREIRNNCDNMYAGGCIGVDIGPKIIRGAQSRYPEVRFEVANAWHTGELLRLSQKHLQRNNGYDVVYVDVGGLSGSDGILEALSLLTALAYSLEPRCLVIKSLCIRRLASSLVSFSEVWQSNDDMRNAVL